MDNSDFNQHFYAIVVGGSSDDFAGYAADLLIGYDVDFVVCEDVYSAAARLGKTKCENTVVIGRLGRLITEHGRLFEKISEKGLTCCCLAEGGSAGRRGQIAQVVESGALVINKVTELEEVITKLLERESVSLSGKKRNNKASGFNRSEFTATKAELDALLEV